MMKNKQEIEEMIEMLCHIGFNDPKQCDIDAALAALDWVVGRINGADTLKRFSTHEQEIEEIKRMVE